MDPFDNIVPHSDKSSRVVLNNKVCEHISHMVSKKTHAEIEHIRAMDRNSIKFSCDPVGQESLSRQYRAENQREQTRYRVVERHITRQRQASLQSQCNMMVKFKQKLVKYDKRRMTLKQDRSSFLPSKRERLFIEYNTKSGRSPCAVTRMAVLPSQPINSAGFSELTASSVTNIQSMARKNINTIELSPPTMANRSEPSEDLKTGYHCGSRVSSHNHRIPRSHIQRNVNLSELTIDYSHLVACDNNKLRRTEVVHEGINVLPAERVDLKQYTGIAGDLAESCTLSTLFRGAEAMSDQEDDLLSPTYRTILTLSNSEENIISKDCLKVDESMRPRANSDPAATKAELHVHFDLPEITIDDFSEELDHLKEKANSSEGAFYVFASPPRRRAHTCPEKYFRSVERPPTPPPMGIRRLSRNGIVRNPPKVSFIHHKLSKVVEDCTENKTDSVKHQFINKDHSKNIDAPVVDKDKEPEQVATSNTQECIHKNIALQEVRSDTKNKQKAIKMPSPRDISPKRQPVPIVSSLNEQHKTPKKIPILTS